MVLCMADKCHYATTQSVKTKETTPSEGVMVTESRERTDGEDAEKEFVKSGMKAEAVAGGGDGSTGGVCFCLWIQMRAQNHARTLGLRINLNLDVGARRLLAYV